MNKITFLAAVFISAFFAQISAAFSFSVSYDQSVSLDSNPVAEVKVVVKDEFMKAESKFGDMTSVMYRNETGVYSYLPAQKVATKIPPSMDAPNLTRDLPNFMAYLQKNSGVKIGAEVLNGLDCDIYEFNEPTIQKLSKAWIWREKSFPVKIEVPAPEGLTIVELSNIQFDPPTDPAVFQLPADAEIVDFNTMAAGASSAPPEEAPSGDTGTATPV